MVFNSLWQMPSLQHNNWRRAKTDFLKLLGKTGLDTEKRYVCNLTIVSPKANNTSKNGPSKRNKTFDYYLQVNSERKTMCKVIFLNTLGLRQQSVQRWKLHAVGIKNQKVDQREQLSKQLKRRIIREFLEFLPKLPSHYCRQNSTKLYLQADIKNTEALYDLFKQYLIEQDKPIISLTTLKRELKEQNISFYRPKKDQCDVGVGFKTNNISQEQFDEHNVQKQKAREEKRKDKDDKDWSHAVYTVDVQAVLICPRIFASALYYKTKLACHNYTFFNLNSAHSAIERKIKNRCINHRSQYADAIKGISIMPAIQRPYPWARILQRF